MKLKGIEETNFQDYYKTSMFLGTSKCNWKCCKDCGENVCQNLPLSTAETFEVDNAELIALYLNNPLTHAIILGGLDPLDTFDETLTFIKDFRTACDDDIVIYTGYTEEECKEQVEKLKEYKNIFLKFGRFIPNSKPIFDTVLGINLASNNQHAIKIS